MSQGTAFFEWRSRTWDGVEFSSEVLLSRIDLKDGPIIPAVVRDISDRKEAEAALREREQELAATRQQALDAQYAARPERFVQGRPLAAMPPETVAINPVQPEAATEAEMEAVNFPTLPTARDRGKTTLSET